MRTKPSMWLIAFLLLALFLPTGASAATQTIVGSVTVTNGTFTDPPTDLVGVAIIHNPGFEKTSSQQLPPFTAPIFLDVDKSDTTGDVLNSRFDTTLLLTNTGGAKTIGLTIRGAQGNQLAQTTVDLGALATVLINLSSLLP